MAKAWSDFHAHFHQLLLDRQLLPKSTSLLIAVSGGQDSLCLLKLLVDLQPHWHWQLAVAHCDHGWPGDEGLAEHVHEIAAYWKLDFYLKQTCGLPLTESAARSWRYEALTEIVQTVEFDSVVTAHTASDRAETMLYNLCRGSGADGLQALTWQRTFLEPKYQLCRPLLAFSRQETAEFCQTWQLPVWKDPANQNLKFARNRIRQNLIPLMREQLNPKVEIHLAQTAEILHAEAQYLDSQAKLLLEKALQNTSLNRRLLQDSPLALQRRVVRSYLCGILPRAPNFLETETITKLLNGSHRSQSSTFPGLCIFAVEHDWIKLLRLK
ncbi:MAG: tRNA lysidine(34) synthetase TilS [Cyanobacteria bacterium P01_H01_bin.15]